MLYKFIVMCWTVDINIYIYIYIYISTDLTLSFVNARLLDDVSFHPCIRYKRWEVGKYGHVFV